MAPRLRPVAIKQGMVYIIFIKAGFLDFFRGKIPGQLMDDGAYHFHVRQFFRADIGQDASYLFVRHCVSLGEISHRCGQFPIRTAKLADDD